MLRVCSQSSILHPPHLSLSLPHVLLTEIILTARSGLSLSLSSPLWMPGAVNHGQWMNRGFTGAVLTDWCPIGAAGMGCTTSTVVIDGLRTVLERNCSGYMCKESSELVGQSEAERALSRRESRVIPTPRVLKVCVLLGLWRGGRRNKASMVVLFTLKPGSE